MDHDITNGWVDENDNAYEAGNGVMASRYHGLFDLLGSGLEL